MPNDRSVVFVAGASANAVRTTAEHIDVDGRFAHFVEPFNTFRRAGTQAFNFDLYIRKDQDDPRHLRFLQQIMRGEQILSQGPSDIFDHDGRRLLIRELRANLWFGWLMANFPEIRLVFVVRHPCAVASSWTLLETPTHIPGYLRNKALMEDHLAPFRGLIEATFPDVFERQVTAWCIQHYVPFRQLPGVRHHLVFYEALVARETADATLAAALDFCNVDADARSTDDLRRRLVRANADRVAVIDGWRSHLTPTQIARANDILAKFGLDDLYDSAGTPNPNAKALSQPV